MGGPHVELAVQVNTALGLVTDDWLAVIFVLPVPGFPHVANPPAAIEATPPEELAQVAVLVMSCVLPSDKVAIAVYCTVPPFGELKVAGVAAIETITGGGTPVQVKAPGLLTIAPDVAVIFDEPGLAHVTACVAVRAPNGATVPLEVAQVTLPVMFLVWPLEYVPTAV